MGMTASPAAHAFIPAFNASCSGRDILRGSFLLLPVLLNYAFCRPLQPQGMDQLANAA